MSSSTVAALAQLLVAVLGGGVVVAIINNFMSPKTKAETRAIAQKSAGEVVQQSLDTLRQDVADARSRAVAAELRADKLAERVAALEDALDAKELETEVATNALKEAEKQTASLQEQLRLLWEWAMQYYAGGHPPGMKPPPEPQGLK